MTAFENGKHALDGELADKICRALKVSPNFFVEAQTQWITALESQVARLNQALAEASRGPSEEGPSGSEGAHRGPIPLFGSLESRTMGLFDTGGRPLGEPDDFVQVPGLEGSSTFAFTVVGEAMVSSSPPSFEEGDIVIFGTSSVPLTRDLALVRLRDNRLLFRQIFFDGDSSVRLQPLNLQHAPESHPRKDVVGISVLAGHVRRAP
jgi:phage repressor protein C with HTH and peptisase S24 domain